MLLQTLWILVLECLEDVERARSCQLFFPEVNVNLQLWKRWSPLPIPRILLDNYKNDSCFQLAACLEAYHFDWRGTDKSLYEFNGTKGWQLEESCLSSKWLAVKEMFDWHGKNKPGYVLCTATFPDCFSASSGCRLIDGHEWRSDESWFLFVILSLAQEGPTLHLYWVSETLLQETADPNDFALMMTRATRETLQY